MASYQKMESADVQVEEQTSTFTVKRILAASFVVATMVIAALAVSGSKLVGAKSNIFSTDLAVKRADVDPTAAFFAQYGADNVVKNYFTGSSKSAPAPRSYVAPVPKKTDKNSEKKSGTKGDYVPGEGTYAFVGVYPTGECISGTNSENEVFMMGMIAEECVDGVVVDCAGGTVTSNVYDSGDCSGSLVGSYVLGQQYVCTADGLKYGCNNGADIHLLNSDIERRYQKGYDCVGKEDSFVAGTTFTAYRTGVCFGPEFVNGAGSSMTFTKKKAIPLMKNYASEDCSGKAAKTLLNTDCTGSDDDDTISSWATSAEDDDENADDDDSVAPGPDSGDDNVAVPSASRTRTPTHEVDTRTPTHDITSRRPTMEPYIAPTKTPTPTHAGKTSFSHSGKAGKGDDKKKGSK